MQNGLEIELNCAAVYGYHFLTAKVPLVNFVTLRSQVEIDDEQTRLELRFEPEIFLPWQKTLGRVEPGSLVIVPRNPEGVQSTLLGSRGQRVKIVCILRGEDRVYAESSETIPLCGFDEFCGTGIYPTLAASFITPEAPSVRALAAGLEGEGNFSYDKRSPEEVRALVTKLYELLHKEDITYSIHPFVPEKKEQRVRLPGNCLASKVGNSFELALLYASLAESLGLDCVLIWFASAVMLGVYTCRHERLISEIASCEEILQDLAEEKLTVLDPSGICYGTNIPFSISEKTARTALENREGFLCAVDVKAARRDGVQSVPAELFEKENAFFAKDILTGGEEKSETDPLRSLREELLFSRSAQELTDCRLKETGLDAQSALETEEAELADFPEEDEICLGVGKMRYYDPVRGSHCTSYALLIPMERLGEVRFVKKSAVILNTLLLDKLSALSGFFAARLTELYRDQGAKALLEELTQTAAASESVSFDPDCCDAGLLRPEVCLFFDSLSAFSLPKGGDALGSDAPVRVFDPSYQEAMEAVRRDPFSLVTVDAGSLSDSMALELTLQALSEKKRVLILSRKPDSIPREIARLARTYDPELAEKGEESGDYLRELFAVHPQGFSFFSAHLLYEQYAEAPEALKIPPVLMAGLDGEGAAEWSRSVGALTDAMDKAGGVSGNPLWSVRNPAYSEELSQKAQALCESVCDNLRDFIAAGEEASELLCLPAVDDTDTAEKIKDLITRMLEGESVPYFYFETRGADTPELISVGKKHARLRAELEQDFSKEIFRLDAPALLSELRAAMCASVFRRRTALKNTLNVLRGCALPGKNVESDQVNTILEKLIHCKDYAEYVEKNAADVKRCFGVDVFSPDLDLVGLWDRLEEVSKKAEAVYEAYCRLPGAKAENISAWMKTPDLSEKLQGLKTDLNQKGRAYEESSVQLSQLLTLLPEKEASLRVRLSRTEAMKLALGGLEEWTRWLRMRAKAVDLGLESAAKQCESGRFTAKEIKLNFLRGFFAALGEHIISLSPALKTYDPAGEMPAWRDWEATLQNRVARICKDCAESDYAGLFSMNLARAHRLSKEEAFDLVLIHGGETMSAYAAAGLVGLGERTVILAAGLKECPGESIADFALKMGARAHLLPLSYDREACAGYLSSEFAADCGKTAGVSAYPSPKNAAGAQIIRVNGGYDEQSGTNIIEASVIADRLIECLKADEAGVTVVCLGENQRRLVTLVLAKRLNALPDCKEKFLRDPLAFPICTLEEEAPQADTVLVSLCFAGAESGYGKGMSAKLNEALGDNCCAKLNRIFTLARKELIVTCAFSMEELDHSYSCMPRMIAFRRFAARLFAMPDMPVSTGSHRSPVEAMVDKIASALREKGYPTKKNQGFSALRADLLICDPVSPHAPIAAVISDHTLHAASFDPRKAGGYLAGLEAIGLGVYHLSALEWFKNENTVIDGVLSFARDLTAGENTIFDDLKLPEAE